MKYLSSLIHIYVQYYMLCHIAKQSNTKVFFSLIQFTSVYCIKIQNIFITVGCKQYSVLVFCPHGTSLFSSTTVQYVVHCLLTWRNWTVTELFPITGAFSGTMALFVQEQEYKIRSSCVTDNIQNIDYQGLVLLHFH